MHKLIIHKLGPIEHAEIDVNNFMVFTGAQASGKSTIAKALYFFRTIKDDVYNLVLKKISGVNGDKSSSLFIAFRDNERNKFMDIFGSSRGMDEEMCLEYYYTDRTYIKLFLDWDHYTNTKSYIRLELSQGIKSELDSLNQMLKSVENSITDEDKQVIRKEVSKLFHDTHETILIPAGRSMITLLATQLNYLYSTMDDAQKRSIDLCTRSYLEIILKSRPDFEEGLDGLENLYPIKARRNRIIREEAKNLIQGLLKGVYRYNGGNERLDINRNHYVKINHASSGQQESVWILNLLFYYLLQNKPVFFIIEEPESHLFPDAQKAITELIALVHNSGHQMLITTHSPYVLGSINNLIYAGQLAAKDQASVEEIISKNLWIKRDGISAWYVEDGAPKDCIDAETGLIKSELIDDISGVINDDFDKLLSIQWESEGAGE